MNNAHENTWTPQHQDLHDALIAERILPNFCRRLSLEHLTIDRTQARAWRTWAHNLTNDPGWPQIQALLDLPDAWPHVWQSLPPNAWSPETDHYNTLFFIQLVSTALADQNFELALYAFKEALAAANRTLQSSTSINTSPAVSETHPIFIIFTQYPFQDLDPLFKIHTETTQNTTDTTHNLAQFVWQTLLHTQSTKLCNSLTPLSLQAQTLTENILDHIYSDVFERINSIDAETATPEQFHNLFNNILSIHTRIQTRAENFHPIFEYIVTAAANTLATNVYLADRKDDFEILNPILKLVQPLNETLYNALKTDPTMSPHFHETCAEFFVSLGNVQSSAEQRLAYFDKALEIEPDNPRAAKRAAQACLERANALLLFTAPVPGFAVQIPGGQRLLARVEQARDLYLRACTLDPTNDLLPIYQTEIALECKRFDIPFEPNPGSPS